MRREKGKKGKKGEGEKGKTLARFLVCHVTWYVSSFFYLHHHRQGGCASTRPEGA